jgi:H2-forming N5,N10-methylenetetrahydromethanopterin dehydrogenase-like enzyme
MQLVKTALPGGELEFGGQSMHVELAEAPTAVEYVPAAQSLQTADPVNALYCPASHGVQVSPSGPENPALQVQLVTTALPAGELEFGGQSLHVELAEAPKSVEYVPVAQSVHAADPVNALYVPAMHAAHVENSAR